MAVLRRLHEIDRFPAAAPAPRTRKVQRRPVKAEAQLSHTSGASVRGELHDVSTHGCNVQCNAAWLRMGIFIGIALGDEPPIQAVVRWVRDGSAGIEFLRPLSADQPGWSVLLSEDSDW